MLKKYIKFIIRKLAKKFLWSRKLLYGRFLFKKNHEIEEKITDFLKRNWEKIWVEKTRRRKVDQVAALFKKVDIVPVKNGTFFYSIDYYKTLENSNHVLSNYTVNYAEIITGSLREKYEHLSGMEDEFSYQERRIVEALYEYYERLCNCKEITEKYGESVKAIKSLFERPAKTLYEGLQRILFYNQFLWQTGHNLNGLGRLDLLLVTLYRNDVAEKRITETQAKDYIREFYNTLHEGYWFKSNVLRGDTGQIIILGGLNIDGVYNCNELTYLFIEVLMGLRLPDPKILLRCSCKMPDQLLRVALTCMETGIGSPIIANDDVIIPALLDCGYDKEDAYNYVTAACWEPLIPNRSCDLSNADLFNFAEPFIEMLNNREINEAGSIEEVLIVYQKYLEHYTAKKLIPLSKMKLEPDPLISLLSNSAMDTKEDITQGGAKYYNTGLTSVGLGNVVNSILNIRDVVFVQKMYTMEEFEELRRNNFSQSEKLIQTLKEHKPCFGCDDREVLTLSKQIIDMVSKEYEKYSTMFGGRFKFGLSAPSYISAGEKTKATFDGRKIGEPFNVHISSQVPISVTELLCFAMELDYSGNRINGNVIDFVVSPDVMKKNFEKYITLLKTGIKGGIFQLQMNVVSSKTLIAAKRNPELFPNLIVRVWGFSAYFNDLPDEYKDVLIMRAIESEKAA